MEMSEGSAHLGPVISFVLWCAWWLGGVNWKKAWPMLAAGGWAPVVLLIVIATLVWSRLSPGGCDCLGVVIPNVWWQLGGVCGLAAVALFCGWLQGFFGWTPSEISLEPPADHDDHAHGPAPAHH